MDIEFRDERPNAHEYRALRLLADWGDISEATATRALASTAISLCVRHQTDLVGLGRVVGDGVLYFHISDVFVHPAARGTGLGHEILRRLLSRIRAMADPGATVSVLAAPGREPFYAKAGFTACPNAVFGHGMAYLEPIERLTPNRP